MKITIPELCLVVLIGPSGSGKSTFARKHFLSTETISSDYCRGLVSNDVNSLAATSDAFDVLNYIASKRLARGLLTVVDATNVQAEARKPLLTLAREHDVLCAAIVLRMPDALCHERNRQRPDRDFGQHVVRNQNIQLRRSLRGLEREGFRYVYVLESPEEVEKVEIERQPLWTDRRWDHGPFDIIGDIHGCFDELAELLARLGYAVSEAAAGEGSSRWYLVTPPTGRKAIFLGDLTDRGPNSPAVLRLVMDMVAAGHALCLPGNHDAKLQRKLRGKNVQLTHGLAETMQQLEREPPEFSRQVERFLDSLVSHLVLDGGRLVVAHAGMKEQYIGRASRRVREFALYGDTTGESDDAGLPVRLNWAADYRGETAVVYGHTPVPEADWLNRTLNVDTGCVFGGKLSALRWPEREVVSVTARRVYAEPARPFLAKPGDSAMSAQHVQDDLLDIGDVLGKRVIATRLMSSVTIREENAIAALEVMSRFAANPKWLIYLPPTMAPTETTQQLELLEHPREAFNYYLNHGVAQVICQEKHMGSRAVAIICRDEAAALTRFGVKNDGIGLIYTRTGRRFFDDSALGQQLLQRVHDAITACNYWEEFASDWFCIDCELMPWSAKAQGLLQEQYAPAGSASRAALSDAVRVLEQAAGRYTELGNTEVATLLNRQRDRLGRAEKYVAAYRRYCWPVSTVDNLKLAPFHLLASEKKVHTDKPHTWHMQTLSKLADVSGDSLIATRHRIVELTDPTSVDQGIAWWEELTSAGGEGMVVKPADFVVRSSRGLVQPAVKCRGKEYLRIIYGPEYDAPEHLSRLRQRGLAAKRSLALREFALGIESLDRFVRREPLTRVHECVFGVLALESEPVDPRL